MNRDAFQALERVTKLGIDWQDAHALRRISMTLQRWHELECGVGDQATYYIERETEDDDSPPHMKRSDHLGLHDLGRVPDREKGARRRLSSIMARYPELWAYVQTDPRGAALYVGRKADLKPGDDLSAHYSSRGVAIFK